MTKAKFTFSPGLFWDVKQGSFNYHKHARFIIGRVLRFGELGDWQKLKEMYTWPKLKSNYQRVRDLDSKSRALWGIVFK